MNEHFYSGQDSPSGEQKQRMWREISRATGGRKRLLVFIPDLRSFAYGIAASVVVYFASVGVVSTVRNNITSAQPDAVRLDEAYRTAIEQFERVVPRLAASRGGDVSPSLTARAGELAKLDAAIGELKSVAGDGDLSPLTQRRLRQLYGLKLQVLQEMIENQEVEL